MADTQAFGTGTFGPRAAFTGSARSKATRNDPAPMPGVQSILG